MLKLDEQGNGQLELNLTILGDEHGVHIEIQDRDAAIQFLEIRLTPADFLAMFSGRLAMFKVIGEFRLAHHIGQKLEIEELTFPMPEDIPYNKRSDVAYEYAKSKCPEGWQPDNYFGSQNSFFYKEKKSKDWQPKTEFWARTRKRRWVEKE